MQPVRPSHPISLTSILILSSHLYLGLPHALPFRFSTKIFYAFLISPICATCPAYLILLDFINLIIFWGCCEHSNELLGSIKGREFLD
jgi:hypothetical protein